MNDYSVKIDIADQALGHITKRDLLNKEGSFHFATNRSQLGGIYTGYIFRLQSNDYFIEAGATEKSIYFERNHICVEATLPRIKNPNELIMCVMNWDLDEISIILLDDEYRQVRQTINDPEEIEHEIRKRKKSIKTPPTLPPNSLITWARKETIAPKTVYKTTEELFETVISSLQSIQDKITSLGIQNPFWDITYEGSKIIKRKPKKETDIQENIHGYLFDIGVAKNFDIAPEYQVGGGKLDFLISAPLKNHSISHVGIEFKHAHSNDIENGLIFQLPQYMKSKGANYGIYVPLFFKGKYFDKPGKFTLEELEDDLEQIKIRNGLKNIRLLFLNLSYKPNPSSLIG